MESMLEDVSSVRGSCRYVLEGQLEFLLHPARPVELCHVCNEIWKGDGGLGVESKAEGDAVPHGIDCNLSCTKSVIHNSEC